MIAAFDLKTICLNKSHGHEMFFDLIRRFANWSGKGVFPKLAGDTLASLQPSTYELRSGISDETACLLDEALVRAKKRDPGLYHTFDLVFMQHVSWKDAAADKAVQADCRGRGLDCYPSILQNLLFIFIENVRRQALKVIDEKQAELEDWMRKKGVLKKAGAFNVYADPDYKKNIYKTHDKTPHQPAGIK